MKNAQFIILTAIFSIFALSAVDRGAVNAEPKSKATESPSKSIFLQVMESFAVERTGSTAVLEKASKPSLELAEISPSVMKVINPEFIDESGQMVFDMGTKSAAADPDGRKDNYVRTKLTEPFNLGKTEITQLLFYLVMGEDDIRDQEVDKGRGDFMSFRGKKAYFGTIPTPVPNFYSLTEINANSPVSKVSFEMAIKFISKLNARAHEITGTKTDIFRLPTEAEWEFAARAGSSSDYYFLGDDEPKKSHLEKYVFHRTWFSQFYSDEAPVASKLPNRLQLYDMIGGVENWCADVIQCSTRTGLNSSHAVYRGGHDLKSYSCSEVLKLVSRRGASDIHSQWGISFRIVQRML